MCTFLPSVIFSCLCPALLPGLPSPCAFLLLRELSSQPLTRLSPKVIFTDPWKSNPTCLLWEVIGIEICRPLAFVSSFCISWLLKNNCVLASPSHASLPLHPISGRGRLPVLSLELTPFPTPSTPHSRLKDTSQHNRHRQGGAAPPEEGALDHRALPPWLFLGRRAEHSPNGLVEHCLQAPLGQG